MSNPTEFIATIKKIAFSGKWVEFWWVENDVPEKVGSFDTCCKIYMFDKLIEDEGWEDDVLMNGYNSLIGKKLKWVKNGYNFELEKFVKFRKRMIDRENAELGISQISFYDEILDEEE